MLPHTTSPQDIMTSNPLYPPLSGQQGYGPGTAAPVPRVPQGPPAAFGGSGSAIQTPPPYVPLRPPGLFEQPLTILGNWLRYERPPEPWQPSPFNIPAIWLQVGKRCPTCGGFAPNICGDVWPPKWWEDPLLSAMYQGHIPPERRPQNRRPPAIPDQTRQIEYRGQHNPATRHCLP